MQLGNVKYLVPVDVAGESEDQMRDETIPLQRLLDDGDRAMVRLSRDPSTAAEDMARACHQLAGTAGTFGTWRLRAALVAAEAPLQSGDTAAAARALADLPAIWAETRAALLDRIGQLTSAA